MTVVINGTTGISGVDGSASTPAVQGSDTNTGIFFPAADTIGLATGGSERVRIDSSGNVGIGTSSPSSFNALVAIKSASDRDSIQYVGGSSYAMRFGSNASFAAIDGVDAATGSTSYQPICLRGSIVLLNTGGTERARISSGGTVFINNSTAINSEILNVRQSSSANLTGIVVGYGSSGGQWRSMSVTSSDILTFNNGLNEGTLSSAGAWTNASDARLKTNIRDIEYGLNTVLVAKPRHFERVDVGGTYIGFVAQELQTVVPEVVSGDPETQFGVDYGSLVAVAFKAIQELNAKVETLEAQNAAFEARLAALEAK